MGSRVFQNAPELINSLNVAEKDLRILVAEVAPLASVDTDIVAKTIHYVVDDTDDDVLSTLGTLQEAALHIRLFGLQEAARGFLRSGFWHTMNDDMDERVRYLNWLRDLPPGVVMRLAEVCEVIGRAAGRTRQPTTSWPAWLELLIEELLMAHWHGERFDITAPVAWSIGTFEAILATADLPADLFARLILTDLNQPAAHSMVYLSHHAPRMISGWPSYLAKHTAFVHHALQRPNINLRIHGLKQLYLLDYDFAPVAQLIATLCTSPSKSLRQAALPALEACRDVARPHLESILSEGTGAERYEAVAVLWRLFGDEVRELLQRHAAHESATRIREDIHKRLTEAAIPPSQASPTLPPKVDMATNIVELNPEIIEACRAFFELAYQNYLRWYEQAHPYFEQMPQSYRLRKFATPRRIAEEAFDTFIRFVEGKMIDFGTIHNICQDYYPYLSFADWQPSPGMALIHVLRVAYAFGQISNRQAGMIWLNRLPQIDAYRRQCATPFGLCELNTAITTLPGIEADTLAKSYLSLDFYWERCFDWEPEAIWPLFAEQEEVLFAALDPTAPPDPMSHYDDRSRQRRSAFRILAMFPQLPPALMPLLWELALGEGKIDRPLAQEAMHNVPNALKLPKIIDALSAGKQAVREAAAAWLGTLGDASAIEPLKQAFHKEKQEIVKGVIMTSLDALGADVNAFLDRDVLLIEARQGLKKKCPKGSEWVPLDNLPTLHWQDRGEAVATEVVQWWVIQSIQQKTPVGRPLLRRYLAMCHPSEAAALARFVLATWIAQDTLPMPYDEAAKKAQQEADQSWSAYGNQPWFADQYGGVKDNLYRKLLQHYTTDYMGSAIGQKGLLAIAAAAGDRECVKLCEQYIRQWFGHRLAQWKCLVEVLAWIEHSAAPQKVSKKPHAWQSVVPSGESWRCKSSTRCFA